MPANETARPASGQPRPFGPLVGGEVGRTTMPEAACVAHVSVAFPVSEPVDNVMVPGGVKFCDGAPNVQVGACTAPAGEVASTAVSATVPEKPPAPVTVIKHEPDCPGAAIVIVELHPVATFKPGPPTVTVTPVETALAA